MNKWLRIGKCSSEMQLRSRIRVSRQGFPFAFACAFSGSTCTRIIIMNATIVSTLRTHLYALTHASSASLSPEPNDRLADQGDRHGCSSRKRIAQLSVCACMNAIFNQQYQGFAKERNENTYLHDESTCSSTTLPACLSSLTRGAHPKCRDLYSD